MPPRIVEPTAAALHEAVQVLRAGGVVGVPTETVYGLAGDTLNRQALARIYTVKGRPHENPLIAHVADVAIARSLAKQWPSVADALAERFWPGPLTIVVKKADDVPSEATAGRETIAVRCPAHSVMQELLRLYGSALSAPSANRSGHVSPTTAAHVAADFAHVDDLLILDGGACTVGIESAVVDVTTEPPRVLRPGSVDAAELRKVLPGLVATAIETQDAGPGTAVSHYAPRTPAVLVESDALDALFSSITQRVVVLLLSERDIPPAHVVIPMPKDAETYAARLYSALRNADELGGELIVIERPSDEGGLWNAVRDRLHRATAKR